MHTHYNFINLNKLDQLILDTKSFISQYGIILTSLRSLIALTLMSRPTAETLHPIQ